MTTESRASGDGYRGQIFTNVGKYRGAMVAVKKILKRHIDINREVKKELKIVSAEFGYYRYLFTFSHKTTNSRKLRPDKRINIEKRTYFQRNPQPMTLMHSKPKSI